MITFLILLKTKKIIKLFSLIIYSKNTRALRLIDAEKNKKLLMNR